MPVRALLAQRVMFWRIHPARPANVTLVETLGYYEYPSQPIA